jgi:hypothetical protein
MMLVASAFYRLPGERAGIYIARIAQMFSGDSLSVNEEDLAFLLSRGGIDDPKKAVRLKTNCATWACSILFACGLRGPVAESFFRDGTDISRGDSVSRIVYGYPRAYIVNAPGKQPGVGAVLHWGTPGINNDHVGIVDESYDGGDLMVHTNTPIDKLTIETTEAGGDNNSVNTGLHSPPYYSWGRQLMGWDDPDLLDSIYHLNSAPPMTSASESGPIDTTEFNTEEPITNVEGKRR